jgi:IS5 family transposase
MEGKMYRTEDKQQLAFKDFYLPFGGKLNPTNRWVQLAQLIPWEDLEEEYAAGSEYVNIDFAFFEIS